MAKTSFGSRIKVTYIGTATAIIEIDGVNFITDPYFSPDGTQWDVGVTVLTNHYTPALGLQDLPPIDAVLLSHEDHPDNLDELGRRLLDGRRVLTTPDGARKLGPRPGVKGLKPWETTTLEVNGKRFEITGTPCQHLPDGECTGFILTEPSFGTTDGLPNAVYLSGDTVYIEELAQIKEKWHVSVALFNLGCAAVLAPGSKEMVQVTMDGKQAVRLLNDIDAGVLIPLHFEDWDHFQEHRDVLRTTFKEAGVMEKVCWLKPGVSQDVL
ncbi:Metallo-hydrolase/oxidoreductase [Xylariaceae sp. FL0016]|nr:Metallo-hydrolase/oxidoreductase [Xylariaceae sp. FL0016]